MIGNLLSFNKGIIHKFIILSFIFFASTSSALAQCPTANAGGDETMCSDIASIAIDATATNYTSILWITSGNGSFDDNSIEDPVYSPSPNDISSGSVILTIIAYTNVPGCFTARNMLNFGLIT